MTKLTVGATFFCGNQQRVEETGRQIVLTRELVAMLGQIRDTKPRVCVKLRKLRERWPKSFMRVTDVSQFGVVLFNPSLKEFAYVTDLVDIVEFELDRKYRNFLPHINHKVTGVEFIG